MNLATEILVQVADCLVHQDIISFASTSRKCFLVSASDLENHRRPRDVNWLLHVPFQSSCVLKSKINEILDKLITSKYITNLVIDRIARQVMIQHRFQGGDSAVLRLVARVLLIDYETWLNRYNAN